MQIGEYYFSKRQTFILIILVLGMVFGLSLVQREQTLKTRAAMISNAFEVYENHYDEGKGAILADCRGQTCTTNTRQVLFKPQPQRTEPYKAEVIPPPPPVTAKLAVITSTAAQITPLLRIGPEKLYSKKIDEPNVPTYWCTFIIVDAYRAAGFLGLNRVDHGGVLGMKAFFRNTPGYQFLSSNTPVKQLRPGDVIFYEGIDKNGKVAQHTSLIKSIDISQAGNGAIKTYESNNWALEDTVSVNNYQAIAADSLSSWISGGLTGFGQVK